VRFDTNEMPAVPNSYWVRERHPDKPWDGEHACGCGAPGAPCPKTDDITPPRMPSGFKSDVED
jgi:hypothetical protein